MDEIEVFKLYRRRWIMLILFCLTSTICASHWLQYSIISNVVSKYYMVSERNVYWTALVQIAVYLVLFVPIIVKKGLRNSVLFGLFFFSCGSWLKLFSLERSSFAIVILSQVVLGFGRLFILSIPPRLASVWFGPSEVSIACAIGVFGEKLGIAVTFLVPPIVVGGSDEIATVRRNLKALHIGLAGVATFVYLLGLFLLEDEPPTPPSEARRYTLGEERRRVIYNENLLMLLRNESFSCLVLSFGLSAGVFYAYVVLMNRMFVNCPLIGAEDTADIAGYTGLALISGGFIGSVIWSVLIDRTYQYWLITVAVYSMSVVGMVLFKVVFYYGSVALVYSMSVVGMVLFKVVFYYGSVALVYSMSVVGMVLFKVVFYYGSVALVYVMSAFLGLFLIGLVPIAYEFAVDLTFPIPESTSAGLMVAANQGFGLAIITVLIYALEDYQDLVIYATLTALLAFGVFVSFFISGKELHRLSAQLM